MGTDWRMQPSLYVFNTFLCTTSIGLQLPIDIRTQHVSLVDEAAENPRQVEYCKHMSDSRKGAAISFAKLGIPCCLLYNPQLEGQSAWSGESGCLIEELLLQ